MADRVAVVKTAWADSYNGGKVRGDHKFVNKHDEGHERFNFRPGPDGSYYGYLPPIGDGGVPSPERTDDWLIAFVAKKPKETGLQLVGWYESASFQLKYRERPEYETDPEFYVDNKGDRYIFCVKAPSAYEIPAGDRSVAFKGHRIKTTPIAYLRGDERPGAWREELAQVLETEIARRKAEAAG